MITINADGFDVHVTDIDYKRTKTKAIIRIFGRTIEGIPVKLEIDDFLPYFFIPLAQEDKFQKYLERSKYTNESHLIQEWLVSTESLSMVKYDGGKKIKLLKLIGRRPWEVRKIREFLEIYDIDHYESDIPFVKRFLIDTGIRGLNKIHVSKYKNKREKAGGYIFKTKTIDIQPSDSDPLQFRKLEQLAFDIEVDDRDVVDVEGLMGLGRRITAISTCWGTTQNDFNTQVFLLQEDSDDDEKRLLKEFFSFVRELQPDTMIGYNSNNFDFPYLLDRADKLKISDKSLSLLCDESIRYSKRLKTHLIKGRIHCDLFSKVGAITTESGRRGLDDVAKSLLGETKVVHQESLGELWAKGLLENDQKSLDTFISYSETDAILTYKLFYALQVESKLELIRITGFSPVDGINATERNIGELELMRKCVQRGVLMPNLASEEIRLRRRRKEEGEGLKGGMVIDPKGTYHKDVIILDFRSLYPSLIIAYNIGGETIQSLDSFEFKQEPKSVLAEMEAYLLSYRFRLTQRKKDLQQELIDMKREKRENTELFRRKKEELEHVDRRQTTLKLVANALYGTAGSAHGRFYVLHVARAITALGRKHLSSLFEYIEEFNKLKGKNYEIVYGDTDSIFVKVGDSSSIEHLYTLTMQAKNNGISQQEVKSAEHDVYAMVKQLLDYLNNKLPKDMRLELEDVAFRIIFQSERKKAYGYVSALSGELRVRGFEAIRGDWTEFAKRIQLHVIDILLRSGNLEEAMKEAKKLVRDECRGLLSKTVEELKEEIIQHAPINQPPSKYKSPQPVMGAFLHYCKINNLDPEVEWRNISKFPYLVLKGKGPQYKRSKHPDHLDGREIDREQYIKEVLGAVSRFGVFIPLEDIKDNRRKTTLLEFIK